MKLVVKALMNNRNNTSCTNITILDLIINDTIVTVQKKFYLNLVFFFNEILSQKNKKTRELQILFNLIILVF